jgi:hypothetical protein
VSDNRTPRALPRMVPEGVIPLISVEGAAYDCGREYAEIVMSKYPGFRDYLDQAWYWRDLPPVEKRLVEQRAPQLLDVYRGLTDVAGPPSNRPKSLQPGGCTSFAVSGSVTLDGHVISGQTKDTPLDRVSRYIVLRMRIKDAPSILVLAYPGEVLGYGMWTTGMTLYRNTLYSRAGAENGLYWVLLASLILAGKSVREGAELATKYGRKSAGNMLIADATGESLCIETNAGGDCILPPKDGISAHANNALAPATLAYEGYKFPGMKEDSQYRTDTLWRLLNAERGRLTAQRAFMCLSDHGYYPGGICKHASPEGNYTTAAVVCEPTLGKLHVVRGHPCSNWPVTYTL